ncbi:MAG: hypothetical protein LBJ73_01105 [Rickettsiales bacterium]|jgi:hypothetical protein|nr:hypothetical protein [Rickettsiales bacterium]
MKKTIRMLFFLACVFCALDARAGCKGTEWTYKRNNHGNNGNAIGCDCSEKSSGYRIYERGYNSKAFVDGNKTRCNFPNRSYCHDTSGARDTWENCTGKIIYSGTPSSHDSSGLGHQIPADVLFEVSSLPLNSTARPHLNDGGDESNCKQDGKNGECGWVAFCNSGFEWNSTHKKCVCPAGRVSSPDGKSCVTIAECESDSSYEATDGACITSKWCSPEWRTSFDNAQHATKLVNNCDEFRCIDGYGFKSASDKSCVPAEGDKFGGQYPDSTTGIMKNCMKTQKVRITKSGDTSEYSCAEADYKASDDEMKKCFRCEETEDFKNCIKFQGKDGINGVLLKCAKCMELDAMPCWE